MKKDVIYIDVEDDITAIIDKLKSSNDKIIALVPPKGNAVLQSTVNLKLLNRAAKAGDKQPVIVTNNSALMALAGGMGMYVAKNLQSKPYVPGNEDAQAIEEEGEIDVGDAVVAAAATKLALDDGDELEVHADELVADLEKDGELTADESVPAAAQAKPKSGKKSGKKVPNFGDFKKKLLIFGGLGAVLLALLIFFVARPKAVITVRAETTPVDVAYEATISNSGTSNPEAYEFRAQVQEESKTVTQDFTPTGRKDVGKKATGRVIFSTNQITSLGTIPAGTRLTSSSGQAFVTDESATLTAGNALTGVPAGITAAASGSRFNGASGGMSGAPSGVSANIDGSTSGGTSKTITVVSQSDVNAATEELKKEDNADVKAELEEAFGDDVVVLDDSFSAKVGNVTSEPAVGKEANEGKLSAEVTYTMMAITKEDLKAANEAAITKEMDNPDQQQVYKDGVEETQFEKIKLSGTSGTYNVTTVGQYGPKFDTAAMAEEIANKKSGEVRSYIQGLPGVKSVDINISPFWSRSTPGAQKIEIKLDVDENASAQ